MDVVAFNGPTASGKSSAAVAVAGELAQKGIAAEIVNADSMLVYRGMDIGTAKPTFAQRGGIPHHLIDIMDVKVTASVADFQQLARATIDECLSRGVLPLLVGGSALYVRAILDDLQFPGTDPQVRAKYEAKLAQIGAPALHAELVAISPTAAAGILPGNGRRTVRALEVIELTGEYKSVLPEPDYVFDDVLQVGLALERPEMDARIAERVDVMWDRGFVAEVEGLLVHGLKDGLTASRALGYRQIIDFLDGNTTEVQAREFTVTATRRFARKQLSWFRRDKRTIWFDALAKPEIAIVQEILRHLEKGR